MTISDSEYLALSGFAYTDPLTDTKGVTQGGGSDTQHIDPASLGWTEVGLRPEDWIRVGVDINSTLLLMTPFGMSAHILTKGNELAIVYRGTDDAPDVPTDIGLCMALIGLQVSAAYWFCQAALNSPALAGMHITFVGHSLGGGLASIMAEYTGKEAVVINAAPNVLAAQKLRDGIYAGLTPIEVALLLVETVVGTFAGGLPGLVTLLAAALRVSGGLLMATSWPSIPAAPLGTPHGTVRRYVNNGDPVTVLGSGTGGGMLGATTTYNYTYDTADAGLLDGDAHSPYLGAFLRSQQERGTNFLALTHSLPDLITTGFNVDVTQIKWLVAGALPIGEDPRYDLFYKSLVQAELLNSYVAGSRGWVDAFLQDLNALAASHPAAAPGDPVTKALTELSIQFTSRQAALFVHRQPFDSTALFIRNADGSSPDVLFADTSRILNGYSPEIYGLNRLADYLGVVSKAAMPRNIKLAGNWTIGSVLTGVNGTVDASGKVINADEILIGSSGNDRFTGSRGNDWILGEGGTDTLDYTGYFSGIKMTRTGSGATIIDGVNYTDHVRDVERIIGTSYSDELSATGSGETHLWGGGGPDKFNLSNKTFVQDADKSDKTYMYGIRLSGGVAQWWSDSGWAYWAPVSSLMMPATMGILGGLVLWADVTRALAFRYGFSATGQLIVQTALGLGGQAVIEKYELDLDTGAATGGVVAFQQNLTRGSLATLTQYLNLALKAGGFGGFMGLDPLVLDLDGDGVELTREDSSKVYFEFDTDGFGERCGWVKGDDALLARDLNSNGKIDNAGELFGNATTSGFNILRTLDSNVDNQITAADAGFSTLRLWRDLNQNGVTDAGELLTLAASGISKISLATRAADPAVVAGNPITAVSDFTRSNGTIGKVAEAQLLVNDLATKYLGNTTVSAAAAALPQLKGYGRLPDLRVAMTSNATLLTQVTAFKALTIATPATLLTSAEQILYAWAGVSAVTPVAMGASFDTRKLAFLEMFNGREMAPRVSGQPTTVNVVQLIDDWNTALRMTAAANAAVNDNLPPQYLTRRRAA